MDCRQESERSNAITKKGKVELNKLLGSEDIDDTFKQYKVLLRS